MAGKNGAPLISCQKDPSLPVTLPPNLPAVICLRSGSILRPHLHPSLFVEHELDVDILDDLANWLWLAGRLDNIRPLHHQHLRGRQIVLTERMRLHLVWREDVIFVKPMPAWMLDEAFCTHTTHASPTLQSRVHGFLRTYLLLVQYPTDFHLAKDLRLLPDSITCWSDWTELASKKSDLLDNVTRPYSPRFLYGELRLHRIDFLYRFLPRYRLKHLFRSYVHGNATYEGFIRRNFAWLLIAFIYITVLLTAMQLGISTNQLQDNAAFHRAAYGFTVFALVLPLAVLVCGLVASLVITVYHVRTTLAHVRDALANHQESESACKGEEPV